MLILKGDVLMAKKKAARKKATKKKTTKKTKASPTGHYSGHRKK